MGAVVFLAVEPVLDEMDFPAGKEVCKEIILDSICVPRGLGNFLVLLLYCQDGDAIRVRVERCHGIPR